MNDVVRRHPADRSAGIRPAVSINLLPVGFAALALLLTACSMNQPPRTLPFDLKIVNGRVLDGTGAPWYRADIGVRGDTIAAIGDLSSTPARSTIDAHELIVAPGFIDLLGQDENSVLADPHVEAKVRQGVTSELTGEGFSAGPMKRNPDAKPPQRWTSLRGYFDLVDGQGSAINIASLVGSSNPREMVIGDINRPPTADEMREMERIVDQAMREGAMGLSSSLIYLPAMYSTTEELVALAKVAAAREGVYFTHMRDEGDHIDQGLDEAFRIGREAKIPVNIWHLKVGGATNWGTMPHVVARIEAARSEGIDVAANVYPYAASGTSLSTLAPDWALEGGYAAFQHRLQNPEERAKIVEVFRAQVAKRREHGIYVSRIDNPALSQYSAHFLEDIASGMNVSPDEALIRLFAETTHSPSVIYFSMNEDDVRTALRQPWVSVGSDSGAPPPSARASGASVHPRGYGTFARVLGRYTRDEKLFTLEEAVRKMTSQAADRANMKDRGILRPGMKADIIAFDPATIRDVATYESPHHFSEGVADVVVNGVPVLRDGAMTQALPGRTLRGPGYSKP